MASTYLTRTIGTPTNAKKGTISLWVKRGNLTDGRLVNSWGGGSVQFFTLLQSNATIFIGDYDDPYNFELKTNRVFRDTSAWYHFVFSFDTTQGTASDRVKFYVNGIQETSFSTETYPSQNLDLNFGNSGDAFRIGVRDAEEYFDGSMSHVHFIDGTAYDASAFGSTDATTGEWKINTSPSVTYGNNGFFILKDGNSVTDQSGNGNNFTVGGGTLTKTEDCPSNVFCVMSPLDFGIGSNNATLSLGNTKAISGNTNWRHSHGTLGVTTGKWYFEGKQGLTSDGGTGVVFGFCDQQYDTTDDPNNGTPNAKFYGRQGTTFYTPSGKTDNFFPNTSGGDILMVALDLDNNKIWFGTNGTWHNTNGSAGNTSYSSTTLNSSYPDATSVTIDTSGAGVYMPIIGSYNDGYVEANFGNGYFGTTQISSAGTNASNNGIFEYDVPTGFTALSTKGLNL